MSLSQNRFKQSQILLAGAMLLAQRKMSPESKIRERNGFVAGQLLKDCGEMKMDRVKDNMVTYNLKTRKYEPRNLEYKEPKPFEHRDLLEIVPPKVDFELRSKPD